MRIDLTRDRTCSINIYHLPSDLIAQAESNYEIMRRIGTEDASDGVLVFNKELGKHVKKKIWRHYKSYGVTPKFDASVPKSYMFSEFKDDKSVNQNLPAVFMPIQEFVEGTTA